MKTNEIRMSDIVPDDWVLKAVYDNGLLKGYMLVHKRVESEQDDE